MFTATRQLAFGTVTLTTAKDHGTIKDMPIGDLNLQHINNHTAIVTPVVLTFKPSRELANPEYPIDSGTAMTVLSNTVGDMWREVSQAMAAETNQDYNFDVNDNELWDAFIASAKQQKFNIDDLPAPIETPIGIFKFVPDPTLDNFTSIDDLPNYAIRVTHERSGMTRSFWMNVAPADVLLEHFNKIAVGEAPRHTVAPGVDMQHICGILRSDLHDVFSNMGYKESEQGYGYRGQSFARSSFGGSAVGAQPVSMEVPLPFAGVAEQLMQTLHEFGERYDSMMNDFTISTALIPDENGNPNKDGKRGAFVNCVYGGLRFTIGMNDAPPPGRNYHQVHDSYRGTVTFMGERRTLSVALRINSRFGYQFEELTVAKIVPRTEVEKAFRVMLDALAKPVGLASLIDESSVSWEPQAK